MSVVFPKSTASRARRSASSSSPPRVRTVARTCRTIICVATSSLAPSSAALLTAWSAASRSPRSQYNCDLGDLDAALQAVSRAAELGASDDVATQMIVRQVRATVLTRGGELDEAERLAREAVDFGNTTDMLFAQGEAY